MAGKNLIGTKLKMNHPATTQVFQATHNGEGARLPLRYRSFISFTWGGKNIEDFNLIATINGDRMSGGLYSAFEDLTSDYEVMDGHFYWGTHFTDNEKEFRLATDAITEQQLQDFIHWFQPGITRELVLAEHPNRAIYARLSAAPSYSLLPFEYTSEFKIKKKLYTTSQTVYRGEISLTFVMEEPYWHLINNVISYYYLNDEDKFGSMTNDYIYDNKKATAQDDDFLKVMIEDNIPHVSMFTCDALLGDKTYIAASGLYNETAPTDSAIVATWVAGEINPPYARVGETSRDENNNITYTSLGARAGVVVSAGEDRYTDNLLPADTIQISSARVQNIKKVERGCLLLNAPAQHSWTLFGEWTNLNLPAGTYSVKLRTTDGTGFDKKIYLNIKENIKTYDDDGETESLTDRCLYFDNDNPEQENTFTCDCPINEVELHIMSNTTVSERTVAITMFRPNEHTITLSNNEKDCGYIYYSGTAPANTKISFNLKPYIGAVTEETSTKNKTNGYIIYPRNGYKVSYKTYNKYEIIKLTGPKETQEFHFALPSLLAGYNQAIKIMYEQTETDNVTQFKQRLVNEVNEYYSRAWAIFCADLCFLCRSGIDDNGNFTNLTTFQNKFIPLMRRFISNGPSETATFFDQRFSFDSKTGESLGTLTFRVAPITHIYDSSVTASDIEADITPVTQIFNVGDMVKSNFLVLKERSTSDQYGQIPASACTKITADYPKTYGGLTNFMIEFKNMYL